MLSYDGLKTARDSCCTLDKLDIRAIPIYEPGSYDKVLNPSTLAITFTYLSSLLGSITGMSPMIILRKSVLGATGIVECISLIPRRIGRPSSVTSALLYRCEHRNNGIPM